MVYGMSDCVFCGIVKGEYPSTKIYEDDHVYAFLDINPVAKHHTLVIPKEHYADLYDIPEATLQHLMVAVKRVTLQLQKEGVNAVNVLHASGVEAQQSVFHFHLHIVPRHQDDNLNHFILPEGVTL